MYRISLLLILFASNALAAEGQPSMATFGLWLSPYHQTDYSVGSNAVDASGPGATLYGQLGDELHAYSSYTSGMLEGDSSLAAITGTNLDVDHSEFRFGAGIKQHIGRGHLVATIEYLKTGLKIDDVRIISDEGMGFHIGGGVPLYSSINLYGKAGIIAMGDFNGVEFKAGVSTALSRRIEVMGQWHSQLLSDSGRDFNVQALSIGLQLNL
jgi:hypothetical protein